MMYWILLDIDKGSNQGLTAQVFRRHQNQCDQLTEKIIDIETTEFLSTSALIGTSVELAAST